MQVAASCSSWHVAKLWCCPAAACAASSSINWEVVGGSAASSACTSHKGSHTHTHTSTMLARNQGKPKKMLRLQGLVQREAAVTVIMKTLESNPMLLPFYNRRNVKAMKELL